MTQGRQIMENKKKENEDTYTFSDAEMRSFMVDLLTDLTIMKHNVYNNRVFDAHRNVQQISDKVKDRIGKL
jgi:hypothetical protein